jgi:hypothetical protein
MITRKKNILGLVPDSANRDDFICILFGCSVPVVLRKEIHTAGKTITGIHFKFIGECYVDGMMDGQALDTTEGLPKNYITFEIR